jgi:protein-disulfide isomerase/rhodanese-related sulfurtransferase
MGSMRKLLLFALSLVGLFDALYLWWTYTLPSRPMVCLGGGCNTVRSSPFAYPWGVPLPAAGAAMYVLLALLIFAWPVLQEPFAHLARRAVAGVAGLGFLFSLYLSGVEAFVLHAWCTWCVISAITVTLIFGLALFDVLRPLPHPEPAAALGITRRHLVTLAVWLVVGAPAFLLLTRWETPGAPQQAAEDALAKYLVRPDSHITGNPNAAVTVVEFGDIECPACSGAEATAREIRERYGSEIRFVFRQFPLTRIHPYAETAAEAVECAGAQGKFWPALERFYKGQADLSDEALARYAFEVGLNVEQFRQCLSSGSMAARVREDVEDGKALGVDRTPTFFIGRKMILGAMRYSEFAQLVEQEIAQHTLPTSPSGPEATASSTALQTTTPSEPKTTVPASAPEATSSPGHERTVSSNALEATSPFASSGPLTNSSFGSFSQFHASEVGCSEADAQKETPDLIHTPEARQAFEAAPKALFVDVRPSDQFKTGRIPGAVNVPAEQIQELWKTLPKNRMIVLYESGQTPGDVCAAGRSAGRVLLASGFRPDMVKIYEDGLKGWEKAGLPVVR